MIVGFACKHTFALSEGKRVKKFPQSIHRSAMRKLWMLNAAVNINDLRVPPSNHLEKLRGDRKGQYSIRINDTWRVCFRWLHEGADDVEIVDYHK